MGETNDEKLDKLWEDTYIGKGRDNPPMTVRLDRLERCMASVEENSQSTRDTVRNGVVTIIVLLVVAFISMKMGWVHP